MMMEMEELLRLDSIGRLPIEYKEAVRCYKEVVAYQAKKLSDYIYNYILDSYYLTV